MKETQWRNLFCAAGLDQVLKARGKWHKPELGGHFGYFLFFSGRGRGKGESEAPGGGRGSIFKLKFPEGGGVSRTGGAEGPGGCLWRIGEFGEGGGLNIFFRGRNVHQEKLLAVFDWLLLIFVCCRVFPVSGDHGFRRKSQEIAGKLRTRPTTTRDRYLHFGAPSPLDF